MPKPLIAVISTAILGGCVFVAAQDAGPARVRLRLVDAASGKTVGGIVRVTDAGGKSIELPGLFDRMAGLVKDLPGVHWYVVPAGGADTTLPRGKLHVSALSGLESERVERDVELRQAAPTELTVKLPFLFHPDAIGLVAGNTHLHLRNFSMAVADNYLRNIPAADGLRVLFISYLERDKEDATYVTNKYPIGDLPRFAATGVLFNNGEEHRHNFAGFGAGYGHVMFLNLKELVRPVSSGPGITGGGFDDVALRPGIDSARKQGATVLWCHNTFGFEDVPSAVTGRLDALNVFDGSRTGTYEDNYYRYLNIGLRLPISTGTDWFLYDFSRVYAEVKGKLTIPAWLDAVKAGRCQATNGPLLTLNVDGKTPGAAFDLQAPTLLKIEASAMSRYPIGRLELVQNGKVIKTQRASANGIRLMHEVRVGEPAWFALRIDSEARTEFNKTIFAHTSPVYVNYRGKGVFDVEAALALLKQVEEARAAIAAKGRFSTPAAARAVLALYDDAQRDLRERVNARK